MTRASQEGLEERLSCLLLKAAEHQDRIWDGLEALQVQGRLSPEAEEHVRQVMRDVSFWIDQCTVASESPPVLLRRMEIQLTRLVKVEALIRNLSLGFGYWYRSPSFGTALPSSMLCRLI
jgi:hypothetical protein